MKFTLTIEGDDPELLARLTACFNGGDATQNKPETITMTAPAVNFPPKPIEVDNAPATPTYQPPAQPAPPAPEPVGDDPSISPPMYDKAGIPWDKRIHSEARSQNADGTWRKRRGVDPAIVQHVEAELRGLSAPASPTHQPPMPSAPVPPPPTVSASDDAPHVDMRGPVQTPGPVPPGNYPNTIQAPPAHPTHAGMPPASPAMTQPAITVPGSLLDFPSIMQRVGPAMSSGRLTQNDLATMCAEISQQLGKTINSIVDCMNDNNALIVCSNLLAARGI